MARGRPSRSPSRLDVVVAAVELGSGVRLGRFSKTHPPTIFKSHRSSFSEKPLTDRTADVECSTVYCGTSSLTSDSRPELPTAGEAGEVLFLHFALDAHGGLTKISRFP